MTDTEKLAFILRAIVTAGGPEQGQDMDDRVFLLALTNWLLRPVQGGTTLDPNSLDCCGSDCCKVTTTTKLQ
jgi:hypothetical protein